MKVLCIKPDIWIANDGKPPFGPSYMETCTVVGEHGIEYYVLAEYLTHPVDGWPVCYNKKHFIPLSDIEETELITEEIYA